KHLSDKLSRFHDSLSDSERLSDKVPAFRVSLYDYKHLSDKFPAFRDSLSDPVHLSFNFRPFLDSLSYFDHLSDKLSQFHYILSDIRTPPLPLHRIPHFPQLPIHAHISHNLNLHMPGIQYRLACHSFSPSTI